MKKILFVDDEPNILQSLQRTLRPMRHEWDMSFAHGGQEALDLLKNEHYSVVVTDMRMPQVDGSQVLKSVKASSPGTARIVLSGYMNMEVMLRTTGAAHHFLKKPCDARQLESAVKRVCQLRELLENETIANIVGSLDVLPSLPKIYTELTEEMNSEDVSLKKIGEIVSSDISMSAKLLQLRNSPLFGLSSQIETVYQVVMFMGSEIIRAFVLSDTVFKTLKGGCDTAEYDALLNHSLAVSSVARALAMEQGADSTTIDQALTAGILHDIGTLILAIVMPEEFRKSREIAAEKSLPHHQVEQDLFGCDHGQIGAYLLGLWGLPDGIVEAVAYHHNPEKIQLQQADEFSPLVAVHLADALVHYCTQEKEKSAPNFNQHWLDEKELEEKLEDWINITRELIEKKE